VSAKSLDETYIEPERYELGGPPAYRFALDRRDFLRAAGAGVIVVSVLPGARGQESGGGRRGSPSEAAENQPADVGAWLHVAEDGAVTVYTGKVEIGQNVRTSLTQAVADELSTPPSAITLVMADTDLTPFDMGTFGSRTTPIMARQLRTMAAAARELLIGRAAERLAVDRQNLVVAEGKIVHEVTGRSLGFGEITKGERLVKVVSGEVSLTPRDRWRVAGTSLPKVNGRAFVTGTHRYTSDVVRSGMLHGKVLRPSAYGATLVSLDDKEASEMAGVTLVRDGDFVGALASNERTASRALASLKAEWKGTPQPSAKDLFDYLKANPDPRASGFDGRSRHAAGSVEEGFQASDKVLDRTYTVAYIAHAPLEPRAAVAEWNDGKLTVWTGTQRPFGVRDELAQAFHLPPERVRVIVPDTGSAYGGKHTGEAAVEAARLAKAAGKPVKLVWTRAEEFTWAYFRPAGVIEVKCGARRDGSLVAWEFHNYNSGASAIRTQYDIPHQKIEFHPSRSPLRQGSYRGLAATANHFARESHLDEMASTLGLDSLEFRLKNLKDARFAATLEAAASRFGWRGGKPAPGHGFGIAGGFEKGSYVAACCEVSIAEGRVKLEKFVVAFECGAVVNPDGLRNQVEGSVVQGIGGALFEAIDFADGRLSNGSFSEYRVPRFSDVPPIETVLLDRKDLPSAGAGETPIVAVAPAIGNAIFQATGLRLRSLPLAPGKLPLAESSANA